MIVSMTGFGDASCEQEGTHYAVEIRSLNNRYYKSTLKLPEPLSGMEPELDSMLRDRLGRGSITYVLKLRSHSAEAAYAINTAALEAYLEQLRRVRGLDGVARIDLAALLTLPGVCQEPRDESDEIERRGPVVRRLTAAAIEKLNAMRAREGAAVFDDLKRHLAVIGENVDAIRARAPGVIQEYHRRLAQRVNELIAKAELKVGESDLLKEIAVFAERADISEELQRLGHHLGVFESACRSGEHAGRKLDFITQEMLREANTIASKANDAAIAGHIVEIKGAIDRLKEQVQNVE